MAWCEVLSPTILVLVAALTVRQFWHQLRCPACRAARNAMRERHPTWRVSDVSHRASETDRDVVAVFYSLPRVVSFPSEYQLVAVGHDGVVLELPDEVESPYSIRGRK